MTDEIPLAQVSQPRLSDSFTSMSAKYHQHPQMQRDAGRIDVMIEHTYTETSCILKITASLKEGRVHSGK